MDSSGPEYGRMGNRRSSGWEFIRQNGYLDDQPICKQGDGRRICRVAGLAKLPTASQQAAGSGFDTRRNDRLVAAKARRFLDWTGAPSVEAEVPLCPDNEESGRLLDPKQACEINVSLVHDVERTGFWNQQIQRIDIV